MQYNEIFEKTKYAFEHDEVFELLTGQKGYAYQAPRYVADVPTCDEFVFRDGIYPYYKILSEEDKQKLLDSLSNAFNKMLHSENEVIIWWALSLLQGQKDQEAYFKRSPFEIADRFLNEIGAILVAHKNALISNRSYMGGGHADGLWGEVRRIDFLLNKDYGISLLGG